MKPRFWRMGARGSFRACWISDLDYFMMISPMRLNEDPIDLFEVNEFGLIADGFEQRADAEVFDSAEDAFGGADDEGDGFFGEGVVSETGAIELIEDKRSQILFIEFGHDDGEGDSGFDVFIDGEMDIEEVYKELVYVIDKKT